MTSIDTRDNLAAIIRRQVSSLAKPPAGGAVSSRSTAGTSPKKSGSSDATHGAGDIAALVARRVTAIDSEDPQRHRKAFRVFLESVLLAELGENLVNDASFHQLVDDVQARMNADTGLASDIQRAADLMLKSSTKQAEQRTR